MGVALTTSLHNMGSSILGVEHLTRRFGGLVAVDDISFDVQKGEVLSIVGPNGAGKTTVFNLITGIDRADAGSVMFDGQNVTGFAPQRVDPNRAAAASAATPPTAALRLGPASGCFA